MLLFSFLAFSETHAPTILHRRAKHFRKTTGNQELFTVAERLNAGQTVTAVLFQGLTRPLRLLLLHPIVQLVSLIQGISYGLLYLVLTTYANLWIQQYGESVATSGLHYFSFALGETAAAVIGGPLMDVLYRKMKSRHQGDGLPELRIPMVLPGFIIAPIGFLVYGWTAQYRIVWPVVDLGMFLLAFGLQLQGQPVQAYIIDAYPDHAGSATAASQLLRSLAAFAFPLFAPVMYHILGYGWANSTLALSMVVLCGPATLYLWMHGQKLRRKAQSSI